MVFGEILSANLRGVKLFDSESISLFVQNDFVCTLNTHTRLTALCPGLPGWAGTRKVKPILILLQQETMSGSGISWAICKSASRSRDNHASTPPLSYFTARMPFLPPNQQCQSTEGTLNVVRKSVSIFQCKFSTGNTRSYDKNACVYSTTLATNCLHDNGLFQPSATKATVVSALCYRHLYTIKTFYGDLLSWSLSGRLTTWHHDAQLA